MKCPFKTILVLVCICLTTQKVYGQNVFEKNHYIGILPSFLAEPYDTIDAIEINVAPLVYEYRFQNKVSIQFRPMVNYRVYEFDPGISQVGGTILVNKYFTNWFEEGFWFTPVLGGYSTYTYNLLDKINTLTVGAELGGVASFNDWFSLGLTLQPGINYYPDQFSQEFVETESGFKGHFGVMFQFGISF